MGYTTRRTTMRLSLLITLGAGSMMVRADVIQSTVVLPPPAGQYTIPAVCISTGCIVNATLDNFVVTSSTQSGGNQSEEVDAHYRSDVYTNSGGKPGTLLGSLSVPGTMGFTYFGRDPSINPLGTFKSQITDFNFQGMLNGNTFTVKENPSIPSNGTTSIDEVSSSPVEYRVSSTFDINAEISINGSPFVPVPTQSTTLSPAAVPEPSYTALAGSMLALLGFALRRKRSSRA